MSVPRWVSLAAVLVGLVALGVALGALSRLAHRSDLRLVSSLAGDRTATLTAVARAASWLGRSWVLAAIAASVLAAELVLFRPGGERLSRGPVLALFGLLGAIVIQDVVKAIVARPRPPVIHLEHVTTTSFPSGHATEVTAFLVASVLAGWRWSWRHVLGAAVATALVVAVAVSRVYLGVHYPTDVSAGIVLGGVWGASVAILLPGRPGVV